jgi:DNA-binding protein HU-beta
MPTKEPSHQIIGKEELVHLTAGKAGRNMRETQVVIDAFLQTIQDEVAKGHQVRLIGFGSWKLSPVSARTIKSIRGGEPIHLPAGKRVSFTTGSQFAQAAAAQVPKAATTKQPSKKGAKK